MDFEDFVNCVREGYTAHVRNWSTSRAALMVKRRVSRLRMNTKAGMKMITSQSLIIAQQSSMACFLKTR